MIEENERKYVKDLISMYQEETGKEPTTGGKITKHFLVWRQKKTEERLILI